MRQSTFQIKISLLLKCTFKYILMYMFFNCLKETFIKQTTDGLSFSTTYRKHSSTPICDLIFGAFVTKPLELSGG